MNSIKIELKWALTFVGATLLWMIMERVVGLHDEHIGQHAIYTNFFAIPAIAVYVFALLDKRKNFYQGAMTYKQGFISGAIITLIVTLFTPATQYIVSTFITPEYFPSVIEYSVREGKMTREDAENYFNMKSYIVQGLVGAPVMGLLTTAIAAYFTRKRRSG